MTKIMIVAAIPLSLLLLGDPAASKSDLEAIKQASLDYGQSYYAGDGARMEESLHPDLAKRVLMPTRRGRLKIEHMSAMTLVQAARSGAGTKTPTDVRKTEVTILDVYGDAASVKLVMHDWIDYMHLTKIGGKWKIVNVLWELTPEAKKRFKFPEKP